MPKVPRLNISKDDEAPPREPDQNYGEEGQQDEEETQAERQRAASQPGPHTLRDSVKASQAQVIERAQDFSRQYAGIFTEVTRKSPFEVWPREAMIDVLIIQNVELRHEDEITHYQLIDICNQIFAGKVMPPIPPPMTADERMLAESAAVRIQRKWIRKQKAKRANEMFSRNETDRVLAGGVIMPPGVNDPSTVAPCPTPTSAFRELEAEWLRPDIEAAKEYAEYNHPRMGGPGGEVFPIKKATLGRYCIMGGCGEQLDLWDEGVVSELAPFGSGITNYFKFEKWCAWTFLMLFVIYIPQIVINTFGGGTFAFSGYTDITRTTLGNLVDSKANTVTIPYCDMFHGYVHVLQCTLDKRSISRLYTYVDMAGCLFAFVAFLWMKSFQKREAKHLDRHTVTASDYTIKIRRVPPDCTEMDVKAHFARALNLAVVQVALAYDNAAVIHDYQERGRLMRVRAFVVNRYRYINTLKQKFKAGRMWYLIRELPFLKSKNDRLLKRIERLDKKIHIKHARSRPLCAFVTFDTQDAVIQAISAYRFSFWNYLCMPATLRLKGRRLRVQRAPEPSLILWENLPYNSAARMRRKFLTTLLAGSLIIVSIFLAFVARYYQQQNRTTDFTCPTTWSDMTEEAQRTQTASDSRYLGCYCSEKDFVVQVNDDLCMVYVRKQVLAIFWTIFSSFSVVVINYLIQKILEYTTQYEKHHSLDAQQLETCIRVFVLKFINTGCIILILNVQAFQELAGVEVSPYNNFSSEWYLTTGLSLLIVLLMNVVSPLAPSLYAYYRTRKAQKAVEAGHTDRFMTQDDMNKVFMGPEFEVSLRYATNLMTFYVCFIYAGCIPILLLVGAISFAAGYWVDKFLFLRYYRIPPQYGHELSRGVASIIQYALLLHLIVSIWSYSEPNVFSTQQDKSNVGQYISEYTGWSVDMNTRLTRLNVLPLLILLFVFLLYWVIRKVLSGATHFSRAIFSCLSCSVGSGKDGFGELNCIDVTYQRAVDRGLIKGLHTYNILQNPKYKAAFGITDAFAAKHRHMDSIQQLFGAEDDNDEGIVIEEQEDETHTVQFAEEVVVEEEEELRQSVRMSTVSRSPPHMSPQGTSPRTSPRGSEYV